MKNVTGSDLVYLLEYLNKGNPRKNDNDNTDLKIFLKAMKAAKKEAAELKKKEDEEKKKKDKPNFWFSGYSFGQRVIIWTFLGMFLGPSYLLFWVKIIDAVRGIH